MHHCHLCKLPKLPSQTANLLRVCNIYFNNTRTSALVPKPIPKLACHLSSHRYMLLSAASLLLFLLFTPKQSSPLHTTQCPVTNVVS